MKRNTQNGTYMIITIKNKHNNKKDEHPGIVCVMKCTGEWRKLHNEELNDLYSLPNIVRVVKSRRMRWAGHVARIGGGKWGAQGVGGET
jgi:hypothetical protein